MSHFCWAKTMAAVCFSYAPWTSLHLSQGTWLTTPAPSQHFGGGEFRFFAWSCLLLEWNVWQQRGEGPKVEKNGIKFTRPFRTSISVPLFSSEFHISETFCPGFIKGCMIENSASSDHEIEEFGHSNFLPKYLSYPKGFKYSNYM